MPPGAVGYTSTRPGGAGEEPCRASAYAPDCHHRAPKIRGSNGLEQRRASGRSNLGRLRHHADGRVRRPGHTVGRPVPGSTSATTTRPRGAHRLLRPSRDRQPATAVAPPLYPPFLWVEGSPNTPSLPTRGPDDGATASVPIDHMSLTTRGSATTGRPLGERGRVRHVAVVVPLRRAIQSAAQRRVARLQLLLDVGRLAAAAAAPPQPRARARDWVILEAAAA